MERSREYKLGPDGGQLSAWQQQVALRTACSVGSERMCCVIGADPPAELVARTWKRKMADRFKPSDSMLQDYVDDRLNERDRAAVAAYLLAHPAKAKEVEEMRRVSEVLQGLGVEVLDEPVPNRLQRVIDEAKARERGASASDGKSDIVPAWATTAVVAATSLCIGVTIGWFGHSVFNPGPNADELALMNARSAYLMYAAEKEFPVEFPADRTNDLSRWFQRSFKYEVQPPALDTIGYRYIGGRLLQWPSKQSGFFLFEGEDGRRLSVVFWPRRLPPRPLTEVAGGKDVSVRFWAGEKFGYAVMADPTQKSFAKAVQKVFSQYTQGSEK